MINKRITVLHKCSKNSNIDTNKWQNTGTRHKGKQYIVLHDEDVSQAVNDTNIPSKQTAASGCTRQIKYNKSSGNSTGYSAIN